MKPTWKHWLEYGALRIAAALLAPLGLHRAGAIGAQLGLLGYWPFRIRRGVVTRHINACFPEKSEEERARLVRATYEHLGRTAMESILMSRMGKESLDDLLEAVDGGEMLERARAKGKGIVIVAGHLGNWELSGAFLVHIGLPVAAVAKRLINPLADAFVNRTRRRLDINVVYDDEAVRKLPRLLKDGYALGLLADQAGLNAATHVPFFGRPARTPRGPAVFSIRFGAPLIYACAARQPNGKFILHLEEVDVSSSGDLEADIESTTARFTRVIEKWVRRYPGQYLWAHRRWKRQPEDTPPHLREP
jgi:Kdo2-lipid IVA lauroyltransferase/acyltransferase